VITHSSFFNEIGTESYANVNNFWKIIPSCFGKKKFNECSGRGTCIDDNVCECTDSIGIECEITFCFGILSNNTSVCSGHGLCTSKDQCECSENWAGENCDIEKCFGVPKNDPEVCNGHGICSDVNTCICESGYEGNNCSVPQCFGKSAKDESV